MASRIGYFIGMALADIRHFFRGRQAIPCTVDWDHEPDGDPDVTDGLTPSSRPKYAVFVGPASTTPYTVAQINNMKRLEGVTSVGFNFSPSPDSQDYYADGDYSCGDCEGDCCLATDTIGEAEGKA